MTATHSHDVTLPRPILAMAISLVAVSLAMTAAVRLGFAQPEAVPAVERAKENIHPVQSRMLTFSDEPDGSVLIVDATTGLKVTDIVGVENGGGFIRGVMRGLARDREMRGIGSQPPFKLTLWQNGALSLLDTATGRSIDLESFGQTNRADFARLLPQGKS